MKLVYYFRQPDNKKEEYELYSNTSLTRVGEVLVDTIVGDNDNGTAYSRVVWAVKFLNLIID